MSKQEYQQEYQQGYQQNPPSVIQEYQQSPPTVIYVTTTNGATAPPIVVQTTTRRAKQQTHGLSSAGILFLSGGMNMALGLGWYQYTDYGSLPHFCYSWFIGVIFGTVLSAVLRLLIPKKFIMGASALLVLVGGIIFTSVPYNYEALLAARYLNGIAMGLLIVTFLQYASEIAADSERGACLAIEQYSISFGIAIQMIYCSYWSYSLDFPVIRLHGIFDIIFALIAVVFVAFVIESPMDLIRQGKDGAALDTLNRMRRPQGVLAEPQIRLEQLKAYVTEQENLTLGESLGHSFLPLVKMILFRSVMLAFCYSLPLNYALQYSMYNTQYTWSPTLTGVCRILGGVLALCLVDKLGRKLPSIISMLVIGALLIGVGSILQNFNNIFNYDDMNALMCLYLFIQLFAGFFAPYTAAYIGEAFPLRAKPYLMDICVIVEQIIQIILIVTTPTNIADNLLIQGVIIVVIFLFMCIGLPETRRTSLAEAQRRFRGLLYMKLN